uniref:(northern house mosquito) hypothetical protein n=1 Tax=Culex pipiens TaxID=7175 RepID=A0A8D8CV17_CULPI
MLHTLKKRRREILDLGAVRLDADLLDRADGAVLGVARIADAHAVGVLRAGLFQAGAQRRSRDRAGPDRRTVGHGRYGGVHRLDAAVDARVRPTAGGRDGDTIRRVSEARIVVRRGPVAGDHHGGIAVGPLRQDLIVQRQHQQRQRQPHRQDLQVEGDPPCDAVPRPVVVGLQRKQAGRGERQERRQHHQNQLDRGQHGVPHADTVAR